jgi:hypothetical protein
MILPNDATSQAGWNFRKGHPQARLGEPTIGRGAMMTSTCSPTVALSAASMKAAAAPVGTPWLWTLAFEHHEDHTPTHG